MAKFKLLFVAAVGFVVLGGLLGAASALAEPSRDAQSTEQVGHSGGVNVASRHHIRGGGSSVQLAGATSRHHIRGTAADSPVDLALYRTDSRHRI